MEAAHTNPMALTFCYSMFEDVVSRRQNKGHDDDEYCIGPHEFYENDETMSDRASQIADTTRKPTLIHRPKN